MPGYKCVKECKIKINKLSRDISYSVIGKDINPSTSLRVDAERRHLSRTSGASSGAVEGIKVYFIENNAYYNRDGLYVDKKGDYQDNLERFAYFCRRSLELLKEINFKADIIHAHDWQASLFPLYLKELYAHDQFYSKINTLLTIHNLGYQGIFAKEGFPKLGLDWKDFSIEGLEFYGKINLLKGGIIYSDIVNTVSPTYSKEILTEKFGFGLEGVLQEYEDKLFGILNGIDYQLWNPATDKFIAKNYSVKNIKEKLANKADLQKSCRLAVDSNIPVLGMVSRLAGHKGFDILAEGLKAISNMDLQLIILGVGEPKYEKLLLGAAKKYPKSISLNMKFDDGLAHKIYAGSDIFLMPSSYEPCGLGQLISLKFGTIPVVFKTGGLADTINRKNGFIFDDYGKDALLATIKKALLAFKDKKAWPELVAAAMNCDFSWGISAKKYAQLYEKAKNK